LSQIRLDTAWNIPTEFESEATYHVAYGLVIPWESGSGAVL